VAQGVGPEFKPQYHKKKKKKEPRALIELSRNPLLSITRKKFGQ
jgi:hypothetical protein